MRPSAPCHLHSYYNVHDRRGDAAARRVVASKRRALVALSAVGVAHHGAQGALRTERVGRDAAVGLGPGARHEDGVLHRAVSATCERAGWQGGTRWQAPGTP